MIWLFKNNEVHKSTFMSSNCFKNINDGIKIKWSLLVIIIIITIIIIIIIIIILSNNLWNDQKEK